MVDLNLDSSFWIILEPYHLPFTPPYAGLDLICFPSPLATYFCRPACPCPSSQVVRENTSVSGMLRTQESYFHTCEFCSMDVVTPVILIQHPLEAWLFSLWDAKLLKRAPQEGLICSRQSARSAPEAPLSCPSPSYLHRLGICPLEATIWFVGLFPLLFAQIKGPLRKQTLPLL